MTAPAAFEREVAQVPVLAPQRVRGAHSAASCYDTPNALVIWYFVYIALTWCTEGNAPRLPPKGSTMFRCSTPKHLA